MKRFLLATALTLTVTASFSQSAFADRGGNNRYENKDYNCRHAFRHDARYRGEHRQQRRYLQRHDTGLRQHSHWRDETIRHWDALQSMRRQGEQQR